VLRSPNPRRFSIPRAALSRRTGHDTLLYEYDDPHHCEDNPAKQIREPENFAVPLGIPSPKGVGNRLRYNLGSHASIVRQQGDSEQYEDEAKYDGECSSHTDDSAAYRFLQALTSPAFGDT
jgi:hypothetical protein